MELPTLTLCEETDAEGIQKLREACHEMGFFYLRGAVDEAVCAACADEARRFFQEATASEKAVISYENRYP